MAGVWTQERRERHAANMRAWIAANPERWREIHNRANAKYRDERWHADRASKEKYHRRVRAETIAFFGGRCVRCGFADPRALQLDHVNGDGHLEKGRYIGRVYSLMKSSPDMARAKYQLLCANCNVIKVIERQEFCSGRRN